VTPEIVIVGRPGQEPPLADAPFVADRHPERCALAGLTRALEAAGDRLAVVVACDHPFLMPGVLRLLLDLEGTAAVRVPLVEGRLAPLVAAYDAPVALPPLLAHLESGRLALRRALNVLRLDIVPENALRDVDPDLRSFLNLNTPEDLERIRGLADAGQKN
jgi:molybdopterin-guanine dinucleotide biosynthesis protein A